MVATRMYERLPVLPLLCFDLLIVPTIVCSSSSRWTIYDAASLHSLRNRNNHGSTQMDHASSPVDHITSNHDRVRTPPSCIQDRGRDIQRECILR
jgi:hypothetical protein